MPRSLLLPGLVNAHSHAFQRSFRGQTEFVRVGHETEDFWSWRTQMYQRALTMSPEAVYDCALSLYQEMVTAGYTSVGEFHYLHHRPDGSMYEDPARMSHAVIQAALDAGLRVCLLLVLYHSSAIGQPSHADQRRFVWPDVTSWLKMVEAVSSRWGSEPRVSVGLAPHSIRAVPMDWLAQIADWNKNAKLPVHMHVCEQVAEVEASQRALGMAPLEAVDSIGLLDEHFVGIHATHLQAEDPARLANAGARVCACPSTEANLGDGFLPALALAEAGVPVCIGSDSHALVAPFEELRMIENHERLQRQRRNVLATVLGSQMRCAALPGLPVLSGEEGILRAAPGLLDMGTLHGADALGLHAGRLAPGALADMVEVKVDSYALRGTPEAWLPEALVLAADRASVGRVWVHGQSVD